MVTAIRNDLSIEGPLDPKVSLLGQRMIDTALASSQQKRTLALVP